MTKVKICGVTNFEDARVAVEAGADFLGFIFYEPSLRYVTPEQVRGIVTEIKATLARSDERKAEYHREYEPRTTDHGPPVSPPSRIEGRSPITFVGVFVNASLETIRQTLDYCQLDVAQLHGDEPPEQVAQLDGRAYKALRPKSPAEARQLVLAFASLSNPHHPHHPALLLDAYHPTLYGGTGHVADWSMAAEIAQQHRIMLAGSLTPVNVAAAIQAVKPWGVDVSSGIEAVKGRKDHERVREFIKTAKNAIGDA